MTAITIISVCLSSADRKARQLVNCSKGPEESAATDMTGERNLQIPDGLTLADSAWLSCPLVICNIAFWYNRSV